MNSVTQNFWFQTWKAHLSYTDSDLYFCTFQEMLYYVDQNGLAVMRSAWGYGANNLFLKKPLGDEACKRRNPPWRWNPGQTSPEVLNRVISGPTKRSDVFQIFWKSIHQSFLGRRPYFGFLDTSGLGFNVRVDTSLGCLVTCTQWIPQIHLCQPSGDHVAWQPSLFTYLLFRKRWSQSGAQYAAD